MTTWARHPSGFSLVEVIVALGIMSFVLVALMGLFTVGLRTDRDSSDAMQAANLASLLIAQRRTTPTNAPSDPMAAFALPSLQFSVSNFSFSPFSASPVYLSSSGTVTNRAAATYGLLYQANCQQDADLYVMLFWPALAAPTNAADKYEIHTRIALPH